MLNCTFKKVLALILVPSLDCLRLCRKIHQESMLKQQEVLKKGTEIQNPVSGAIILMRGSRT